MVAIGIESGDTQTVSSFVENLSWLLKRDPNALGATHQQIRQMLAELLPRLSSPDIPNIFNVRLLSVYQKQQAPRTTSYGSARGLVLLGSDGCFRF